MIVPNPVCAGAPGGQGVTPWRFRRDTRRRARARDHLAHTLWSSDGARRLPTDAELVAAIGDCAPGDLWWVCEASSPGPVYFLPTVEWVQAFASHLEALGVETVLEVACGDGFLACCLASASPRLRVVATDSGAWGRAGGRMNADDRSRAPGVAFAGIRPGSEVLRLGALAAVAAHPSDVVLVSWAPPGRLVDRLIMAPDTKLLIEIGADGAICGNGTATWRFNKDFVEGPVEDLALCRLDADAANERHTRVTHYYGRGHEDFEITPRSRRLAF